MNNEEKILALLEKHSEMFEQVFSRMDKMQEAQDRMQEAQDRMQEAQDRMQEAQDKMQGDIASIKARLDYDIDTRLNALAEGQAAIEKRLDTLDAVKELAEETKDRVDVIHAVVTQHSAAITELKKVR